MVNATRAKASLRNLKTPAFAQDQGVGRNVNVGKANVHVAVRRVIMTINLHGAQHLNPRRFCVDDKHAVLGVAWRVGISACHHDVNSASRITGPTCPPFLTIQCVAAIVVLFCPQRNIGGITTGDRWFGHQIGATNFTVQ